MAYQMRAERDNEKAQSRSVSLFIAAAKARVWASEGWQVVVTDDTGKTFTPAELEVLCAPDAKKSRRALPGEDGQGGDSGNAEDEISYRAPGFHGLRGVYAESRTKTIEGHRPYQFNFIANWNCRGS